MSSIVILCISISFASRQITFSLLARSQQAVLVTIVQSKLRFFKKNLDYILFQENNIFINEITVLETSMFPVYNIITVEADS
jgi:hypothetical protein